MPIQGWELSGSDSNSNPRIVVAPFKGEPKEYQASGPFDFESCKRWLDKNELSELDVHSSADKNRHLRNVAQVVDEIKAKDLRKVVIARREVLEIDINPLTVFKQLCDSYPEAVVYAHHSKDSFWMGATPETLLTTDEHAVYTMALAGTRKPDGPEFSLKEVDEQAAVTESIRETLLNLGAGKVVCRGPEAIQAGPVEHLITRIESSKPSTGNPQDWAAALHPTPAVCGMPRGEASGIIDEVEGFNRSLYAGYFGWVSDENSRFYVNLRCMQVGQKRVALYAGGGITAKSDPESEWDETVNKLHTLKAVISSDKTSE